MATGIRDCLAIGLIVVHGTGTTACWGCRWNLIPDKVKGKMLIASSGSMILTPEIGTSHRKASCL